MVIAHDQRQGLMRCATGGLLRERQLIPSNCKATLTGFRNLMLVDGRLCRGSVGFNGIMRDDIEDGSGRSTGRSNSREQLRSDPQVPGGERGGVHGQPHGPAIGPGTL